MTRAIPHLEFAHPWSSREIACSKSRVRVHVRIGDDVDAIVDMTRCVAGRLHNAYPVGASDVEFIVQGVRSIPSLTKVLRGLVEAMLTAEPSCRRIIYAVSAGRPQESTTGGQDAVRAAQAAGFRYVTDVDTGDGEELQLFVVEPDWVTTADIDLNRVPDS